jgi:SAM-dependent methyltransferase
MEHWDGLTFGQRNAADYDEHTTRSDTPLTVDALARLADGGPVLELAVGTGRIALPLAARGLRVDGVEISPEMVAQLRAKPGGDELTVTIGDMADVPVDGEYRLVYVVYNTLFNLVTQDAQVRCFQNVAAHLTNGGRFVIEAFVPSYLVRLRDHQYVDAEAISTDEIRLDVGRHDPIAQRLDESHVRITERGIRLYPVVTRYAWPAELDLMARLAGLRLEQRWAGWSGEPFTADSSSHVSVYLRPS